MKQINYKKLILPNIPYVFFVYLFDKVGQAVRLSPGAGLSGKLFSDFMGFLIIDFPRLKGLYQMKG